MNIYRKGTYSMFQNMWMTDEKGMIQVVDHQYRLRPKFAGIYLTNENLTLIYANN